MVSYTRSSFSVTPLAPSATLAGRTEASAGSRSNQSVSFRCLEAPMEGMNLGPKVWQKWMSFLFQGFGRLKTMGAFVLLLSSARKIDHDKDIEQFSFVREEMHETIK